MKKLLTFLTILLISASCSSKLTLTQNNKTKIIKYKNDIEIIDGRMNFVTIYGTKQSIPLELLNDY